MRENEERLQRLSLLPLDEQLLVALNEDNILQAQKLVSRGAQLADPEGKVLRSIGWNHSTELIAWVVTTWPWLIPAGRPNGNARFFFHAIMQRSGSARPSLVTALARLHPWLLDESDEFGRTALHAAAMGGDRAIAEYTTEQRPRLLVTASTNGKLPSEIATEYRHDELAMWLTAKQIGWVPDLPVPPRVPSRV